MTKRSAFGTLVKIGQEAPIPIASATWAANVATFNTKAAHGLSSAQTVTVRGMVPAGYNGTYTVTVTDPDTFTVALLVDPGESPAAATGYATLADTFASIVQCRSISAPELSADAVDVTTHDDEDAWRTFVAGLIDAGEVTLELVFDPADPTHVAVHDDLEARVGLRNFQVIFPNATADTWAFVATVSRFAPTANADADLVAAVTLKVTGEPELA